MCEFKNITNQKWKCKNDTKHSVRVDQMVFYNCHIYSDLVDGGFEGDERTIKMCKLHYSVFMTRVRSLKFTAFPNWTIRVGRERYDGITHSVIQHKIVKKWTL